MILHCPAFDPYESIRVWCQRFGTQIAAKIRRDRPALADKWHLDEVVVSIRSQKHWLWRAVDANGDVLEIPVRAAGMPVLQSVF